MKETYKQTKNTC